MKYSTYTEEPFAVIALEGEVDLKFSPKAREQILQLLGRNNHVLVDLSAVSYIDSFGVASLVEGLQYARTNNLQFGLVGVSKAAMQVLQLARLDRVFSIYETVSDAQAG